MTQDGLPVSDEHVRLMRLALKEARLAGEAGEIPVGAIVVDPAGRVLATGRNACRAADSGSEADPTAHAEMVAIREAARHVSCADAEPRTSELGASESGGSELGTSERGTLEGCTLVVTLEPCAMCAGAILAARIPRVVFGAWDEKAGAAGSVHDLLRDRRLPHRCEVIAGVEEESSTTLLREFFAQRR